VKRAATEIPELARSYLQQAFETLHAPDAAAVMAGSAVDAMLKHLNLVEGSVYSRIEEAVSQHILTPAMGEWAHEVRLGSNRPRHADKEDPHVSLEQAKQSVEFAEALGHFLFVLSSRVKKGIADAKNPNLVTASPRIRDIVVGAGGLRKELPHKAHSGNSARSCLDFISRSGECRFEPLEE
jgi:hypothetical protein